MRQKKAGIITMYASQNFGAFLQSYAMQTVLQRMNYCPLFIKYSELNIHEFLYMVKTKNLRLALFRLKQYQKYIKSRVYLYIEKKRYRQEHLDLVVVGSDTLWDVQNPTIIATDFYLGKCVNADRIIAYAPSCNGTTADEFIKVYKENNPFKEFYAIGVRDENTKKLVETIGSKSAEVVLDPTLLLDEEDYPIKLPKRNEKYILVYGYSFQEEERIAIRKEAESLGAKIISLGLLNTWCDENIAATVPEFLGYIKNAEYIFTSTFHGTIFAVILRKQFVSYARKNYKILYLLKQLGLEMRNGSRDTINSNILVEKSIDYFVVEQRLKELREVSLFFLEQSIK